MLALIARMKVQTGKELEFEQVMGELAAEVRKHEAGCKLYALCKGREVGEYVILERYENQEALTAHSQSAHFKAGFPRLAPLLDGRAKIEMLSELD